MNVEGRGRRIRRPARSTAATSSSTHCKFAPRAERGRTPEAALASTSALATMTRLVLAKYSSVRPDGAEPGSSSDWSSSGSTLRPAPEIASAWRQVVAAVPDGALNSKK